MILLWYEIKPISHSSPTDAHVDHKPSDRASRLKDELRWIYASGTGLTQRGELAVLGYANRWSSPLVVSVDCIQLLRKYHSLLRFSFILL